VSQRKGVGRPVLIGARDLLLVSGCCRALAADASAGGAQLDARPATRSGAEESEPRGFEQFSSAPTVRSVVDSLRKAKSDSRIAAVVVAPTAPQALWAKVQEVPDAILEFKQSDKPIIGYLEYGGEQEFYLASACDKVYLMPTSTLDLTGMATYELFFRGTLDKIGAHPDLLHIGDYKTAANTFTEKTYTAAHREMAESLNHDPQPVRRRPGREPGRTRRCARSSTTSLRRCRRPPPADDGLAQKTRSTAGRACGRAPTGASTSRATGG
jgi:protease-4